MLTRRTIYPAAKIAPARSSIEMQIADYLVSFWPALPEKHIEMNASGQKYSWAKDEADHHIPLTDTDLLAHARGTKTIGAHLHNSAGLCRIGMLDIDQGGRTAILAALAAAHKLGYTAYGLYVPPRNRAGAEHDGGRLVVPFAEFTDKRAIIAVMEQIRDAAGLPAATEIWPGGGNAVALPFAYHVRKGKRGTLLDQAGELLDLDQPAELGRAVELVTSLRPNAAPTPAAQASDKAHYAQSGHVQTSAPALGGRIATPHATPAATPGATHPPSAGRIDTKDIGAQVRAKFNADNPDAIRAWLGAADRHGNRRCTCAGHSSEKANIVVWKDANGIDRAQSYSSDCTIFPLHKSRAYLDPFNLSVIREHGGDYKAAIAALAKDYGLWVEPEKPAPAAVEQSAQRTPAQIADAERKREGRRAAAAAVQADVRSRAHQDSELTTADRAVLDTLLTIAGDRDWCRPSKEQIADVSGIPLGTVKRALFSAAAGGRLEGRYFVSQGKGGGAKLTAIRTFVRGSFLREMIHESVTSTDPTPDQIGACERRAIPPAANVYADSLEAWQYAECDHSADELSLLELPPAPLEPAPPLVDPELRIYVYALAVDAGQPRDYAGLDQAALEAEALRLASVLDQVAEQTLTPAAPLEQAQVELERASTPEIAAPEHRKRQRQARAIAEPGGASYTPSEDFTVGARRKAGPIARRVHEARQRQARADRYIVELARMKAKELKGEKKKYQCIIAKFEGQHWLEKPDGPCDRLRLVELEIDARGISTRPPARRSQAQRAPEAHQALLL